MNKSSFMKNLSMVVGSSASAQIIGFLFIPVISRLFPPEAIGLQNIFISFVTMLTPLGALTLPFAIVLAQNKISIKSIIYSSINVAFLILFIFYLLLIIFYFSGLSFELTNQLGGWLYIVPIYLLILTLIDISKKILIKDINYIGLSKLNLCNSLINNTFKVFSGMLSPTSFSLLISLNFANLLGFLYSIKVSGIDYKKTTISKTQEIINKYYDFPLYRCPQMLINAFSQGLPVLFLANFFGVEVVGYYGMAILIITAPVNLLGNSLNSLLYPKFVDSIDNKCELKSLLIRSTFFLAIIAIFPFGMIYFFGKFIFSFVLGDTWAIAGEIAEWLSVMCYFSLIARPSICLIPVINLQKAFLKYEVFSFFIRTSSLLLGIYMVGGYLEVVKYFSLVSSFVYLLLVVTVFYVVLNSKYQGRS